MNDKAIIELIKEAEKWDMRKANSDPDSRLEVDENDDVISEEEMKEKNGKHFSQFIVSLQSLHTVKVAKPFLKENTKTFLLF